MKVSVEKNDKEKEEEVVIRCHDLESEWVDCVREAEGIRRWETIRMR